MKRAQGEGQKGIDKLKKDLNEKESVMKNMALTHLEEVNDFKVKIEKLEEQLAY